MSTSTPLDTPEAREIRVLCTLEECGRVCFGRDPTDEEPPVNASVERLAEAGHFPRHVARYPAPLIIAYCALFPPSLGPDKSYYHLTRKSYTLLGGLYLLQKYGIQVKPLNVHGYTHTDCKKKYLQYVWERICDELMLTPSLDAVAST